MKSAVQCKHPVSHRGWIGDAGHLWCGVCGAIYFPVQRFWMRPQRQSSTGPVRMKSAVQEKP